MTERGHLPRPRRLARLLPPLGQPDWALAVAPVRRTKRGGAARGDAICSALQLINFWQDLSVDLPRARHYLTDADCAAHGVSRAELVQGVPSRTTTALLATQAQWARALMLQGAPLVHRLPGRAGWELRLVVQGGLRILDKIDALHGRNLCQRPTLRADWLRSALAQLVDVSR